MKNFNKFLKTKNEAIDRTSIFGQLKQILPTWPDYVINDMIMPGFSNPNSGWKTIEDAKRYLETTFLQQYGKRANQVRWRLMPVNIKMDIFDSVTMQTLPQRVQGEKHQGPPNKNDTDRGQYAAKSLQGKTSYEEPIILAKLGGKYQLIEGWHRVIELLINFPQGTMQQAYVMS